MLHLIKHCSLSRNQELGLKQKIEKKFRFIQDIRSFFLKRDYLDVMTPPMVSCPGIEPHLHPFEIKGENGLGFLHTSPEFHMKELLSQGLERIFNISYCFRDEPRSETHRSQFLMLEWYKTESTYKDIMKETMELAHELSKKYSVNESFKNAEFKILTVKEAFKNFCEIDLDDIKNATHFKKEIETKFPGIPMPEELLSWDDYFFLLFLNEIEPKLKKIPKLILTDYPASQAALSTIKKSDPSVCERFEIYLNGVEIGNCFNELRDLEIQKTRYDESKKERMDLYKKEIPKPTVLFNALEVGLPKSSGIAVGVERLYGAITGEENIFWD